jgi:hypothetical protein
MTLRMNEAYLRSRLQPPPYPLIWLFLPCVDFHWASSLLCPDYLAPCKNLTHYFAHIYLLKIIEDLGLRVKFAYC